MELVYLTEAAEEFGRIIWPMKKQLRVTDLMLYGSVAKRNQSPNDIDLLIIHNNPLADIFYFRMRNKGFLNINEELEFLRGSLGVDFGELFRNSKAGELIQRNLFHTSYMNETYFGNSDYRKGWDCQANPKFARDILGYGFLWNGKSERYDLPAREKYKISHLSTEQQNQP
jgi:predicted nucleotidyltransferase